LSLRQEPRTKQSEVAISRAFCVPDGSETTTKATTYAPRPDMADTHDLQASTASHRDGFEDEESLTPLEQEVLDEYARLLGNLNNVRPLIFIYYD
jgi:hypothetical protein